MAPRLAAALVVLLSLGALASAQEVEVKHWFPDNPTTEVFPGKTVPCVLGVRNTGAAPLNVTLVAAHLASPYNATLNIYNFTSKFFNNQPLGPGSETSLEYALAFPKQLPPREFILRMNLVLNVRDSASGREAYLPSLFFNQTINVVEEATWIDTQLIGLYIIFLGVVGLTLYSLAELAKSKGWISKKSRKAAPKAAGPVDNTEWLQGTAYEMTRRKSAKA